MTAEKFDDLTDKENENVDDVEGIAERIYILLNTFYLFQMIWIEHSTMAMHCSFHL